MTFALVLVTLFLYELTKEKNSLQLCLMVSFKTTSVIVYVSAFYGKVEITLFNWFLSFPQATQTFCFVRV